MPEDGPLDQFGHYWKPAPPGTATGSACVKCGCRKQSKYAMQRCGMMGQEISYIKPAKHDFDPYK